MNTLGTLSLNPRKTWPVPLVAVSVAEEQARVARLAYREGLITSVELQGAELALTAARFNLLTARPDAALAQANLAFSIGEWMEPNMSAWRYVQSCLRTQQSIWRRCPC